MYKYPFLSLCLSPTYSHHVCLSFYRAKDGSPVKLQAYPLTSCLTTPPHTSPVSDFCSAQKCSMLHLHSIVYYLVVGARTVSCTDIGTSDMTPFTLPALTSPPLLFIRLSSLHLSSLHLCCLHLSSLHLCFWRLTGTEEGSLHRCSVSYNEQVWRTLQYSYCQRLLMITLSLSL